VSLVGPGGETAPRIGLVDTGAENVLAAGWLADLAELSVPRNADTALIGIGGHTAEVPFVEVELRLYPPDAAEEFISWRCDVGFVPGWQAPFDIVLGQVGFLDRFTATFHREQPCSHRGLDCVRRSVLHCDVTGARRALDSVFRPGCDGPQAAQGGR
jgi:hypothetical protein